LVANLILASLDKILTKVRHVLGISGGKDSAALAIYLKQKNKVPDIEYFFTDTGVELPEIYTFLDKLEIPHDFHRHEYQYKKYTHHCQ
jgi:3'-phosphoadenosine 5'-phosphosulfate sulfotransferase (PAPS reductase)/FAD synthetase